MEKHQNLSQNTAKVLVKCFFILFSFFMLFIESEIKDVNILKVFIVVQICLITCYIYIKVGLLSPIGIFWGMLCFFYYNRILFNILGLMKYESGNFFDMSSLSVSSQIESLYTFSYSLLAFLLAILVKLSSYSPKFNFLENGELYYISNKIYKIIIIISFYFLVKEAQLIMKSGYISIYSDFVYRGLAQKLFLNLPLILYCVNISTGYKSKIFIQNTILMFIFLCVDLIKGDRSLGMSVCLMIICYYSNVVRKNSRIKVLWIFIVGLILSILSIIIGMIRGKENIILSKVLGNISVFFTSQTITGSLVGKAIEYKNFLYGNINIFVNLSKEVFKSSVDSTGNFETLISKTLNKNLFDIGFGLDGNPFAELYIYTKNIYLFFISLVLVYMIILILIDQSKKSWVRMSLFFT